MNLRIAALDFITRSLAVNRNLKSIQLRDYIGSGKLDMGLVVGMANRQLVTPALWAGLRNKGLAEILPKDFREYIVTLYLLNKERNLHMMRVIMEVVSELNGHNIEPLLLKGAGHLLTDTFGDHGARMMSDVDMLVPADEFQSCLGVLHTLNFRADEDVKVKLAEHHHHAPLCRPGDYVPIELHRDLMSAAGSHMLPTETAWAHTRLIEVERLRMRVLSPTYRVLHNVLHSEVVDRNHQKGMICLRQIHDLVSTCDRYGPEIDWRTIRECMDRHGKAKVLDGYLYLSHRLFGMVPSPQTRHTSGGFTHYLRCHLKIRFIRFDRWDYFLQRISAWRIRQDYRCGSSFLSLNLARMRYAFYLLKKYTGREA